MPLNSARDQYVRAKLEYYEIRSLIWPQNVSNGDEKGVLSFVGWCCIHQHTSVTQMKIAAQQKNACDTNVAWHNRIWNRNQLFVQKAYRD